MTKVVVNLVDHDGEWADMLELDPSEIVSEGNPDARYRVVDTIRDRLFVEDTYADMCAQPSAMAHSLSATTCANVDLRKAEVASDSVEHEGAVESAMSSDNLQKQIDGLREQVLKLAYELFELKSLIAEDTQCAYTNAPTMTRNKRPSWMDKDPSELTPKEKHAKSNWEYKQRKKNGA